MKAFLKNYRQAPRKVRHIANAIRGRQVKSVLAELAFMPQKVAPVLRKLVASALANAKQADPTLDETTLMIHRITVDKGITYTRYMPRAFGRASPINRECAHVRVELAPTPAPVTPVAQTEPERTTLAASARTKKR